VGPLRGPLTYHSFQGVASHPPDDDLLEPADCQDSTSKLTSEDRRNVRSKTLPSECLHYRSLSSPMLTCGRSGVSGGTAEQQHSDAALNRRYADPSSPTTRHHDPSSQVSSPRSQLSTTSKSDDLNLSPPIPALRHPPLSQPQQNEQQLGSTNSSSRKSKRNGSLLFSSPPVNILGRPRLTLSRSSSTSPKSLVIDALDQTPPSPDLSASPSERLAAKTAGGALLGSPQQHQCRTGQAFVVRSYVRSDLLLACRFYIISKVIFLANTSVYELWPRLLVFISKASERTIYLNYLHCSEDV
jgi:hypothetical protein